MMRVSLVWLMLLSAASSFAYATDNRSYHADSAILMGAASTVAAPPGSNGVVAELTQTGQGVKFADLPASGKLAIRYGSVSVGAISVSVNGQPARKVNVHSSGDLTRSLLVAKI